MNSDFLDKVVITILAICTACAVIPLFLLLYIVLLYGTTHP